MNLIRRFRVWLRRRRMMREKDRRINAIRTERNRYRTGAQLVIILAVVLWIVGQDSPVLFPDANLVTIMNNTLTVYKGQDALASVSMDWVFIVRVGDFLL